MSDSKTSPNIQRVGGNPRGLSLLLLSDCHSQPVPEIVERIQKFSDPIDAILYGGDGLQRFNQNSTNYLEILAEEARIGLLAVAGNDDSPAKNRYLVGENVYDVHEQPVVLWEFAIVGQEGVEDRSDRMTLVMNTYDRDQIESRLRRLLEEVGNRNVVILSHSPPDGILDRAVRYGDIEQEVGVRKETDYTSRSIGSKALSSVLKEFESIRIVVCGHVHKMGGKARTVGSGRYVVNVASHDAPTSDIKIGRVEISEEGQITSCTAQLPGGEFRRSKIAELRSVPGIGDKTARNLVHIRIESVEELANASPNHLQEEIPHTSRSWRILVGRAEAHHTGTPVFFECS